MNILLILAILNLYCSIGVLYRYDQQYMLMKGYPLSHEAFVMYFIYACCWPFIMIRDMIMSNETRKIVISCSKGAILALYLTISISSAVYYLMK